jgi:hypothetical protein
MSIDDTNMRIDIRNMRVDVQNTTIDVMNKKNEEAIIPNKKTIGKIRNKKPVLYENSKG